MDCCDLPPLDDWADGQRHQNQSLSAMRFHFRAKQRKAPVAEVATPEPEKTAKASATVTLEQIKAVALTVKALGGYIHVNELLVTIKEVGGLKKFKDLLEAMSGTEADAIPF